MSASPQLEEGHTRIANEILEAFLDFKLTSRQWSVVMCIVRKTYGYNKKEDDISASQVGSMCEMHRVHVTETLNQLARMNIISKRPGVFGCIVSIQKDHTQWISDPADKNVERRKVDRVSENHYTYRVTHDVTGEFYIGVRSCKCHPNQDRYVGSGNWVATVGTGMLSKEVLTVFKDRRDAEKEEVKLIREFASDPLLRNVIVYTKQNVDVLLNASTNTVHHVSDPVLGVTEFVQVVQERDSGSTEPVTQHSTESVHTKDNSKEKEQKKAPRQKVTFKKWIENCKQQGISPIPKDDSVFDYIQEAKIPEDFLRLHWKEFKARYLEDDETVYKVWPTVFRKSVRGIWFKLWYFDKNGVCVLSSPGIQAKNIHEDQDD